MQEFLTFRKFVTPIIIQIIFWIGVAVTIIFGIISLFSGGAQGVVTGLLMIILGPIFVRVYCEIVIVIFRQLEALERIAAK